MSHKGLFAAAFALVALVASCSSDSTAADSTLGSDPATTTFAESLGVNLSAMTELSSSLYTQDLVVGTGTLVAAGDSLTVTYTGWLANGTKFDSNVGGTPFTFALDAGTVIKGWDEGLAGMRSGGTRRLVVGSSLGYGTAGSQPKIPSNATLVFTIQLTGVKIN